MEGSSGAETPKLHTRGRTQGKETEGAEEHQQCKSVPCFILADDELQFG